VLQLGRAVAEQGPTAAALTTIPVRTDGCNKIYIGRFACCGLFAAKVNARRDAGFGDGALS
jgi:hypothetical protein